MSRTLSRMYHHLKNSIVSIEGVKSNKTKQNPHYSPFMTPFEKEEKKISFGSGVIIHPQGYILTCHHVVNGMNMIRIKLGKDKNLFQGKVIWAREDKDIAVVQISPKRNLPTIQFSSSKNSIVGERVFAIGNPFGFDHTLTSGVLSGKNRNISTEDHNYKVVLQTDTALNPGNSGGPLFNSKGKVIGINAVIIPTYQNMGFAIPTEEFLPYIKRFLPHKKYKT
jgi:serine protease Do